jgi:hypothetical protein
MRIEINIIEIGGCSFRDLAHKSILGMGFHFGRPQVPSVHIFVATVQGNGKVKGFGQVYGVVSGIMF